MGIVQVRNSETALYICKWVVNVEIHISHGWREKLQNRQTREEG